MLLMLQCAARAQIDQKAAEQMYGACVARYGATPKINEPGKFQDCKNVWKTPDGKTFELSRIRFESYLDAPFHYFYREVQPNKSDRGK